MIKLLNGEMNIREAFSEFQLLHFLFVTNLNNYLSFLRWLIQSQNEIVLREIFLLLKK